MFLAPTRSSTWHPRRLARSAGALAAAAVVAGGAFLAVLHFQPAVGTGGAGGAVRANPAVAVGPDPTLTHGMGPGDAPWMFNLEGGQVTSQFNAVRFTPEPDGSIDVVRPVSVFYLSNGKYLLVTGDTGQVRFTAAGTASDKGLVGGGSMGTPDTGRLHAVHIALFPSIAATSPTLTVDTDNVRFDNATLRLYTETIPATATTPAVAADRVPVVVRGADYDMDGTGLTLRMSSGASDRDRQLHLLEIAHGNRLTIRHPKGGATTTATTAVPTPVVRAQPLPGPLAAAPPTLPPATGPTTVRKPPAEVVPQPYRATFVDHVRIVQGDPLAGGPMGPVLATGDMLAMDFLQERTIGDGESVGAAASTRPARASPPTTGPAFVPSADVAPPAAEAIAKSATRPAAATAPAPTTGPPKVGEGPITLYWAGKLRVVPLAASAGTLMPLDKGQTAARLVGRPATLTVNGARVDAATATYRSGDDAVQLDASPDLPLVQLTQNGAALVARSVHFDPATGVATVAGPAHLDVAEKSGGHLTADWLDRGLLHVASADPGKADRSGIDAVDLTGSVTAGEASAFHLDASRLLLDLDLLPAAKAGESSREQLRRLTAVGAVACRLLKPGQPDRNLDGDRLVVNLLPGPDGQPAPHDLVADGHVRLADAEQALRADHVEAELEPKPTTRPTLQPAVPPTTTPPTTAPPTTTPPTTRAAEPLGLASLLARGHVRAALKNGSTAEGDALREQTAADGRRLVELSGGGPVVVTSDKGDRLVGSVLHVAADDDGHDVITVDGPGTLHSAGGKAATRPADVSWADGLSFDTAANTADVVGHVVARTTDAKGAVNTVTGDTAHLTFAEPAKAPPKGAADQGNLGGRDLRTLTLTGHVVGRDELAVGGTVVRFAELSHAERLTYDAVARVARVPGPGTLFVENHRPPTTAPVTGGRPGEMALVWRGDLTYDGPADRITVTRDARAGFQPDGAKGGPSQLWAERLDIDLKTTPPGPKPGATARTQVSQLRAVGAVHFRTRTADVYCHAAEFDPDGHTLVAHADRSDPGRIVTRGGAGIDGGFDRLVFDTDRDEVRHVDGGRGTLRR